MTRLRLLRTSVLEELRSNVRRNLDAYRNNGFPHLANDGALWFEHGVEINVNALASLLAPKGIDLFEPHNSITLYRAMQEVTPYEARDERLWSYLTHTILLDHARQRWPIPTDEDEATAHILKHFFARDKRQIERDNAASRLWWMGHLCVRVTTVDLAEGLQALLFRSDVRANLVERPTSAQTSELFGAILRRLVTSLAGKQILFERENFRKLMREVNSVGGYKLLDCLDAKQVEAILDDILVRKLGLMML